MNGSRFDAFTRSFASAGATRATRRALLQAGSVAGVAAITPRSGRDAVAQEAQAVLDFRRPGGPTFAQLAFDLEYDPDLIFAFVRDEVRYDPYPGVLRGAKGTLWGLAGNSADQATLLAALLSEALVTTRFVVGELDDDAATRLEEAGRWDEAAVREHAQKVLDFTNPGSEAVALPEPTAEQQEQAQRLIDEGAQAFEEARGQIDGTVQMLRDALNDVGIELPGLGNELPERERRQHVWLQVANGPDWVDLDPAIPGAEPGTTYAANSETLDELPADLFHTVTVRVIAEVVTGGAGAEQELLTYTARAADLTGEALTFAHLSRATLKGLGFLIVGGIEGTTQFVPNLFGPGLGEAGLPLTFGAGEGIFDVGGSNEGEAIAEWLEIEVAAVDRPVRIERRTIFDRVGAEQRLAGTVDLAALPPIELTDFGEGETGYMPLQGVTRIVVSGSEVPGSYFVQDYAVADPLADLASSLYGQMYTRTMMGVEQAAQSGARLVPDAPSVSMLTLAPRVITPERAEGQLIFDLVHQGLGSVPIGETTPGSHPGLLGGVLDHTAERLVLESAHRVIGVEGPAPVSVGRLFEAAVEENVAIVTIAPGATLESNLVVSERARTGIERALADGHVVVVPERAIDLGQGLITGWWQIDPETGTAFDRLETGQGAALLLSPMGEQTITIYNGVHGVIAIRRMTLCIVLGYLAAAFMLAGAAAVGAGALGGSVAAAVAGGVAGGQGAAGAAGVAVACG